MDRKGGGGGGSITRKGGGPLRVGGSLTRKGGGSLTKILGPRLFLYMSYFEPILGVGPIFPIIL